MKIMKLLNVFVLSLFLCVKSHSMEFVLEDLDESSDPELSSVPIVPFPCTDSVNVEDIASPITISKASENSPLRLDKTEFDSAKTQKDMDQKDETSTLKSFHTIHLLHEFKLYRFCDPTRYVKGSREYNESVANFAYSQSPHAQKPFSPQPERKCLKDEVGIEIERWLRRAEDEIIAIKKAHEKVSSWKNTQPNWRFSLDRIKRHLKYAEANYYQLLDRYLRYHGPREVMLGIRPPTSTEITSIELKIFRKSPPIIISQGRRIRSAAKGTSYTSKDSECYVGFFSEARQEKRHHQQLKQLMQITQREQEVMGVVWLEYSKNFLPQVESWSQLMNWAVNMNQLIENSRRNIMGSLDSQTSSTTLRDLLLAETKQQITFEPLYAKVHNMQKFNRTYPNTKFSKVYKGIDDLYDATDETHEIDTKGIFSSSRGVTFQQVKIRRWQNDEERFQVRVMWINPKIKYLDALGPNGLALYLNGNDQMGYEVFWKVIGKDEKRLENTKLATIFRDTILQNKDPNPEDRRELLTYLLNENLIERKIEVFNLPKGALMIGSDSKRVADKFPDIVHVIAHRSQWIDKGIFEEIKNPPKLKPSNLKEIDYVHDYNLLFQEYETLFPIYIKLLIDMYSLYKEGPTFIPSGYDFYIDPTYKLPEARMEPNLVSFPGCAITDEMIQKAKNSILMLLFGCPIVNLSHNALTGVGCYGSANLTNLNLQGNKITSLLFLNGLHQLLVLNLNNNELSDLSGFLNGNDLNCPRLQELNLSSNKITDVKPLALMRELKTLNVSENQIENLCDLVPDNAGQNEPQNIVRLSALEALKANNNRLKGPWANVVPQRLDCLIEIRLKGNIGLQIPGQNPYMQAATLKATFPSLKSVYIDNGDFLDITKQSAVIDLTNQALTDTDIKINSEGSILSMRIESKGQKPKENEYSLADNPTVDLSLNQLTGNSILCTDFTSLYIVKLIIAHNDLVNLAFLSGLKHLTDLNISFNKISDLTPLSSCSSLVNLDLSSNALESLVPLEKCTELETLKANNNKLYSLKSDVFPRGLNKVTTLEICKNPYIMSFMFEKYKEIFPNLQTLLSNPYVNTNQDTRAQGS